MLAPLHFPNTIYHGPGSLKKLGDAATLLKTNHLFIILSKRATNEMNVLTKVAEDMSFNITFFTECTGEPTTEQVSLVVSRFKESGADSFVALGGGSIMDLAKAASTIAMNPEVSIKELQNIKKFERFPLITIPTTAGTGSEVTRIAVITDTKTNVKYNPGHPRLIPDIAILDAELTTGLPKHLTAMTGIDALAHAMEAYVSTKASAMTDLFAIEAIQLIGTYLPIAYAEPNDLAARDKMLFASCLAGIAFSNASTNLAHATARPLGTRLKLPHGLSVALTLPLVITFGMEAAKERYEKVAKALNTDSVIDFVNHYNHIFKMNNMSEFHNDQNWPFQSTYS